MLCIGPLFYKPFDKSDLCIVEGARTHGGCLAASVVHGRVRVDAMLGFPVPDAVVAFVGPCTGIVTNVPKVVIELIDIKARSDDDLKIDGPPKRGQFSRGWVVTSH